MDDSETTIDQKLALMADPLNSQFILEKRERSDETGHDLHHQRNFANFFELSLSKKLNFQKLSNKK